MSFEFRVMSKNGPDSRLKTQNSKLKTQNSKLR